MRSNPISVRIERIALIVLDSEELASLEEKAEKYADLHDAVHENIAPHCAVYDHGFTALRQTSFDDSLVRRLSSQRKRSESVHD